MNPADAHVETRRHVRVFRYGLLAPTLGADIVSEQMQAAHRYQNKLVEIERARRKSARDVLRAHGDFAGLEARVDELAAQLGALRVRLRGRGVKARTDADLADREAAATFRQELTLARRALRGARLALGEDPAAQAALAQVNADARAQAMAARAASGVYWGSYLQIEQAMDAARRTESGPQFRRWTGDGAVAVQLQQGLSVPSALSGADRRLQLDLAAQPVPGRQGRHLGRVRLRVMSEARNPVWAEWPIIYHRPLPQDGQVKWAKVVRRVVAARTIWSLHLTVECLQAPVLPAAEGAVAVDLGWRRLGESLRAGGWTDHRGNGEDLLVDPAVRGMLRKAAELRAIRDRHLNEIRAWLSEWRSGRELGGEHAAKSLGLDKWLSPARFAGLAAWWHEHRCEDDAEAVDRLETWRRRDKHLWQWEVNTRRRALLRRREQSRVLSRSLATRYETLVIERLNLAQIARIPPPESERVSSRASRAQRFEVAPGELRAALVHAFVSRGRQVVTVAPRPTAAEMLQAYRERLGVEPMAYIARVARFGRSRRSEGAGDDSSAGGV